MHVFRGIRGITLAEYMIPEWAELFRGKSLEELDALAASWKFENCAGRERLNQMLGKFAVMKADDSRLVGKVIPSAELPDEGVFEISPQEKAKLQEKAAEQARVRAMLVDAAGREKVPVKVAVEVA